MTDWLTQAARGPAVAIKVANTSDDFEARFWPGLQAALARGLTDEQVAAAMAAAREESARWAGEMDWHKALGAIVGAAFRAVSGKVE